MAESARLDARWRFAASNGYTWRLALPADLPRIAELWVAQEGRSGETDRPNLMEMPVVLTLVAEDVAGTIVEALYAEATLEWVSVGISRPALRGVHELFPVLERFSGERSIRVCKVVTPRRLAGMVRRFIPGLKRLDPEYAHFVFRVR